MMRGRAHQDRFRRAGTLLTALAALLLVFAPVWSVPAAASAGGSDIDLAQYALPDGSVPFICFGDGGGSGTRGGIGPHCPLCTVSKAFALPPKTATPLIVSYRIAAAPILLRAALPVHPIHVALGSRAPPVAV